MRKRFRAGMLWSTAWAGDGRRVAVDVVLSGGAMPGSPRTNGDGPAARDSADADADGRPGRLLRHLAASPQRIRQGFRNPAANDLASRLRAGDLINSSMRLAALVLMMFFPFMIVLAALSPLGPDGAADVIIGRMGLRPDAAQAVERLFTPRGGTVRQGWTLLGALWLILGGLSLAAAVQAVYVGVFGLRRLGLRGLVAQAVWLFGLIVFLSGATAVGALLTGTTPGQVCFGLLSAAGLLLFFWAGTGVLVLGRLGWREIWPTAVFTTIGLTGLGVVSRLSFSSSIVANERDYGSIGVVFTILSWLIGFGVVLTGGAIVGMWYSEIRKSADATAAGRRGGCDSGPTAARGEPGVAKRRVRHKR